MEVYPARHDDGSFKGDKTDEYGRMYDGSNDNRNHNGNNNEDNDKISVVSPDTDEKY